MSAFSVLHKFRWGILVMFYNRFIELVKREGRTKKSVLDELGIIKGTCDQWRTRGSTPNAETVQKIADYFGVSVAYLLGKEDKEEAATPKDDRSAKEAQAMDLFSRLSPEEQEIVLAQLRGLTDGR